MNQLRGISTPLLRASEFSIPCWISDVRSKKCIAVSAALWTLLLLVGCGGPLESTVSGTVYLDEKPLPIGGTKAGNVTFFPSEGGAAVYGQMASGGAYQLSTGSEEGLKPGEYQVVVVATDNPPASSPGQAPPPGKRFTPEKYSRKETTDLVVNVEPGDNQIDLRMTSQ